MRPAPKVLHRSLSLPVISLSSPWYHQSMVAAVFLVISSHWIYPLECGAMVLSHDSITEVQYGCHELPIYPSSAWLTHGSCGYPAYPQCSPAKAISYAISLLKSTAYVVNASQSYYAVPTAATRSSILQLQHLHESPIFHFKKRVTRSQIMLFPTKKWPHGTILLSVWGVWRSIFKC